MHILATLLLQLFYTIGVFGLALYGFNALWLSWWSSSRSLPKRRRSLSCTQAKEPLSFDALPSNSLPHVTVQLPVFNERHVVERLIDACANLDYPSTKLQIQVLDDSTDQTTMLIQRRVRFWQREGCNIQVIHRQNRQGYKAGALAHALPLATGEFIALFDADFVPPADFLQRTIPHFLAKDQSTSSIGFVQTRWGHLNQPYSPLTRSQALALDGHFAIEQAGRQAAGYPFGFNGSAGVWRRACIDDPMVGGWQTDTLCEDLDLSYRAQLAGWRPLYLNDIVVPAEIPPQLSAFKRQQFRWAKGSIQTLLKSGTRVWHSQWPLMDRLSGLLHLGSYLLHPLLFLILLVSLPLAWLGLDPASVLTYLSVASVGPPLLYALAQRRLYPQDWWKRWSYISVLTLLGFGLCLNNSVAVWQALRGHGGEFLRTPKFHVEDTSDRWQHSAYRLALGPIFWGEVGLMCYALSVMIIALAQAKLWAAMFLCLYVGGFGTMVGIGLWQAWQSHPRTLMRKRHKTSEQVVGYD